MARLRLRPAEPHDRELLWRWANDPAVRANAFRQTSIAWGDHRRWFDRVLADDDRILLIAETEGGPVGQIRFDRRPDGVFETDVSIASSHRGRGLAATVIRAGVERLTEFVDHAVAVRARVLPHNTASKRSFGAAGFEEVGRQDDGTVVLQVTMQPRQYR